mmetsp:Transcript_124594/g.346987  ORF Transcript_124594/g.346987 Transcript_124594/m.346987 type:complete len:200 (-) Transcript_124594:627-1226(-)
MLVHSASSFCALRIAQSDSLLPFLSRFMMASTSCSVIKPPAGTVSRGPNRLSKSASVKPLLAFETLPLTLSTCIMFHEMPPSRACFLAKSERPLGRFASSRASSAEADLSSPEGDEPLFLLRFFFAFFLFFSSRAGRLSAFCGGCLRCTTAAVLLLASCPPTSSSSSDSIAASWNRRLHDAGSSWMSAVEEETRSTVLA